MKTNLIFASLLALTYAGHAQNNSNPWPTTGYVGIGTTSPGSQLDVQIPSGYGNGGIRIQHNGVNSPYINLVTSGTGAGNFMLGTTGIGQVEGNGRFVIHDANVHITRLLVDPNGNIGINNIAPAYRMDLATSTSGDDGIKIKQSGSGSASLFLHQNSSKNWAFNALSSGDLNIKNVTDNIDGIGISTAGRVYIGGTSNPAAKLYCYTTNSSQGIFGQVSGSSGNLWGLHGQVNSTSNVSGEAAGIYGTGQGSHTNYGGKFYGWGDPGCTAGVKSYGIYASVANPCTNDMAGLFDGNVTINGVGYLYTTAWTSDQKLKKDIKPLAAGMDQLRLLKPSTYTFRTDEFKDMNLPKEQQIGLIAQDLEKVFPELVLTVPGHDQTDESGKVTGTIPDHKAVNYIGLIPVLIAAVQEQDKTIQAQQQMINKQSNTTGISQVSNPLDGFVLEQNIPNPFSNETVINYTLPEQVKTAALLVYDLTGKQITTFALTQKGAAAITITSEKLSAGIYIYSVVADGKILDSKRMVVAEK